MKELSTSSEASITQRLADSLRNNGYVIADNVGRALGDNRAPTHAVGLLCPGRFEEPPRNGVGYGKFRIMPRKRRRLWLGTIWTTSVFLEVTERNWRFDVNSDKDLPEAERLKSELERTFGVSIAIKVVGSQRIGETLDRDKD